MGGVGDQGNERESKYEEQKETGSQQSKHGMSGARVWLFLAFVFYWVMISNWIDIQLDSRFVKGYTQTQRSGN